MPTPAKTSEPVSDITLVEMAKDGATFTAELFGAETFMFSTDVNAFLLLSAARDGVVLVNLMDSLVEVVPEKGESIDDARERERERFHELLGSQRGLSVERLSRLIGDIIDMAGNEEPSDQD